MKKQTMYNHLQKQYAKLNLRIQKAMQTGRFYAYTQFKQQQLLSRLKRCSFQLKQLGAGVAVVAALGMATPAVGQYIAPNFVQKTGTNNPFDGLINGYKHVPSFADIDGDGDLDLILGDAAGGVSLRLYTNMGTNTNASFVQGINTDSILNATFGLKYPSFVDIDNDGDLDLFGGKTIVDVDKINYYENVGTVTAPVFIERTGGDNPLDTVIQDVLAINSIISSNPFFVDIDNDGDQDCFVSSQQYASGYVTDLFFYENIGTVSSPSFVPRVGVNNPLSMVEDTATFEGILSIQFADMDNDGDQDAFLNSTMLMSGNRFNYYENIGTASNAVFILNPMTPLDSIPSIRGEYVTALVDIDGDGDLDVYNRAGGYTTQAVSFYENCDIKLSFASMEKVPFLVYPNPTLGSVNFREPIQGIVYLYNMSGQVVLNRELQNEQELNLELLQNGIYFLEIQTEKGCIREKVILQK